VGRLAQAIRDLYQNLKQTISFSFNTQEFLDGKDLDVTVEANKETVEGIQRKLNEALHSIPFTLKCYTTRGRLIACLICNLLFELIAGV